MMAQTDEGYTEALFKCLVREIRQDRGTVNILVQWLESSDAAAARLPAQSPESVLSLGFF
jgi:hypothetical protein